MSNEEFEHFVQDNGKDILRFCRMTSGDKELGDELYQDTMLKLLEKRKRLDFGRNLKSYALSVSILLWKNRRKKYANRNRIVPMDSTNRLEDEEKLSSVDDVGPSPEDAVLKEEERTIIMQAVADLPEKFRLPIYLFYSSSMSIKEIAQILQVPEGTVKSRMNKAKQVLKRELEAVGYDR
ncbi:MAG: RNA polymerase sigma factor [Lachnospiraceae bacterium]|nr:RNA polymerase sigma factor [Lachnospiraceae bacterium]